MKQADTKDGGIMIPKEVLVTLKKSGISDKEIMGTIENATGYNSYSGIVNKAIENVSMYQHLLESEKQGQEDRKREAQEKITAR